MNAKTTDYGERDNVHDMRRWQILHYVAYGADPAPFDLSEDEVKRVERLKAEFAANPDMSYAAPIDH
jgi:hypothetical protein